MSWKEQLESYESAGEWKSAVELMTKILPEHADDPEAWVRTIYLLWNIVLEEYPESVGLRSEDLMKQFLNCFDESYKRFADNAEYLFFMGIVMVDGWYFGQSKDELALSLREKAAVLEPNNILYEWGALNPYRRKEDCERKTFLAKQIFSDSAERTWLEQKGFPGQYVLNVQLKGGTKIFCLDAGVEVYKSIIPYGAKGCGLG